MSTPNLATDRYNTQPEDAVLDTTKGGPGYALLVPGLEVTLPLRDGKTGLRARMTSDQTEEALARLGFRLIDRDEIDKLRDHGRIIPWESLPTIAMLHAASIDPSNAAAVNWFRDHHMSSFDYAKIEDEYVDAQIEKAGWDGVTPLLLEKMWFRDKGANPPSPPKGRGYLKGLWEGPSKDFPHGRWIQAGATKWSQGPHGSDAQYDYLSLGVGARDVPIEACP